MSGGNYYDEGDDIVFIIRFNFFQLGFHAEV
jgi:hypothetical protein